MNDTTSQPLLPASLKTGISCTVAGIILAIITGLRIPVVSELTGIAAAVFISVATVAIIWATIQVKLLGWGKEEND